MGMDYQRKEGEGMARLGCCAGFCWPKWEGKEQAGPRGKKKQRWACARSSEEGRDLGSSLGRAIEGKEERISLLFCFQNQIQF